MASDKDKGTQALFAYQGNASHPTETAELLQHEFVQKLHY
jgi:hypothetical protein